MTSKCHRTKAEHLLLGYRAALWRKTLLESVYGLGYSPAHDCTEHIRITQDLVNLLRNKRLGEKQYWVVYTTYMTDLQPGCVDEILANIAKEYGTIPRRTYFRLKAHAIEFLDTCLYEMAMQRQLR